MASARTRRTQAIVLDRTKLAETDLILTLLAQDGSQVRAVAKGARRPGGKLAARCEFFYELDLLLAHGKSLDIVSEAQIVRSHEGIHGDLDRVSAASAIAEVAKLSCFEDSQDPFLYAICSRALEACEQAQDRAHLDLCCAAFALKVLARGGWKPELEHCIECGDEAVTRISVAAGGVLCESCAREIEGAEPVSPAQIAWLQALITSTFDALLESEINDETSTWLVSFVHLWTATHLDARLKSWEFMLSV